jgi:hypothetical protein
MAYQKRIETIYVDKLEHIKDAVDHLSAFVAICDEHELSPAVIGGVELSRIKSNLERMKGKIDVVDGGVFDTTNRGTSVRHEQVKKDKPVKIYK